ncbi:chemotaxis protein CheA [Syntrophorhabdus aromaticivorans]|uniref:chemotaxis protein CheA n=1 Tax=Syntrophorhabdus aromaticivorans TaxID=328301 RepID=UPI0004207344|nr:chemotaxis protein CheA [Syntrophorhabdus aromaticivorans]
MSDIHREAYREEAYELLADLETSLLELERSPDDQELVGRVFRAMHTIKGSGSMFGFDDIANFTHEIETVFDLVRNGEISVTKMLIDLTLHSRDCIRMMLEEKEDDEDRISLIRSAFQELLSGAGTATHDQGVATSPGSSPDNPVTYRIRFLPNRDIFAFGTNPIPLLNELRGLGTCSVMAQLDSIPPLEECDPEACYTSWDIVLTTDSTIDSIKDVFIFVEDQAGLTIDAVDEKLVGDDVHEKMIGEILVERGDVTGEDLARALGEQKMIGEILVNEGLVSPGKVQAALLEQEQVKKVKEKQKRQESVSSIRVPAERLDKLVDLVGELVTVQARLTQKAGMENDPDLLLISEQVQRLTDELRDNTMSIRMLPIGTTFGRFKRLVRDLSGELGKEIELITEGAETELDKTVIERLNDPLVHIIRNSIDHGIEHPAVREAYGKPRTGVIHLSAQYAGANVLIKIKDDGFGLDTDTIRTKAIEKGLMAHDAELSDKDIFAMIFAPGFSTAKEVTSISGRGVGMDVVKKTIDALRGSIEVDSEKEKGTTVTLKLPLTLAIIDGLMVKVGEGYFVLPLSAVEECIELSHEDLHRTNGQHLVDLRGQLVPYIRLRESFGIEGQRPELEQVVITEAGGHKMGFTVDQVIGEHQTVIKSLSKVYKNVDGVSGATIMGDGNVALILDVNRLAQTA